MSPSQRASALPADLTQSAEAGLPTPRRRIAIACVLGAMALVVHSAAVTNVALPALASSFGVTPDRAVRVVAAYQLALVLALLPCAALGERFGSRRVFGAGVALFTLASVWCAWAASLPWLLAARFVQGLGGAAVMALGIALLRFSVPRQKLAAAIGWNALVVALSSAAAPTSGVLLLSSVGLDGLFAIHVPIGLGVLLAARALPADVAAPTMPLNVSAAKASLLAPFDLLRAASFRISVIASICCFAGQAAALVALPFHLQHAFAQDTLATGLLMTPWPLSVALTAPVAGHLADRLETGRLCALGGVCLAIGLGAAALWPPARGVHALMPCLVLCGVGFGLFQVPNNRNMLLAAPRARSGAAGAMQGTARLLGQTLGAGVMMLLFALTSVALAPRIGLGLSAVLTLVAGAVSMRRVNADPKGRTPCENVPADAGETGRAWRPPSASRL